MQSRLLLNIALLVLVTVLAVFIYFSYQKEQQQQASTQLTELSADDITRISILHKQRKIVLEKIDDDWRMLEPISINANAFRIDTLMKMLNAASHIDYDAGELDLHKYGLANVSTAISFNDTQIIFGITNPVNNYRYVRVGNRVHLMDDHFYPILSSQTGTLVARELLPQSAQIQKLVLPEQTLTRDEKGNWHSSGDTSADEINETLRNWKNSQAFGVHNYNQRESLGTIEVHLTNETEPVVLQVTDTEPWLIIARPDMDIEYHFNLEFYDGLLRPGAGSALHEERKPEELNG